ncbi:universal stress protein [Natronoarchaeum mannanilyticum]|uniref:UspA domain-containing protein n=1 Tax=Natronoarchaeum mannanilyticum TaxID=926360 RepID=A0AAV3T8N0_9EURY
MAIDTLLVAVGTDDGVDTDTLADAVVPLAESTGATVLLAHALSRDEVETAAEQLDVDVSTGSHERPTEEIPSGGQTSLYQKIWPGDPTSTDRYGDAGDEVVGQFAAVDELDAALDDAAVERELVGTIGEPAPEVVRLADERDADMIVVGRRDRSGASQALFGSTSEEIVERSPVPVVVASE